MNKRVMALGRMKSGVMNRLEKEYSLVLDAMQARGEVLWWCFEGLTFKLAEGSRYTPDFAVLMADGQIEIHETKGRWIGDAKTKIKVASAKFPFQFRAVFAKLKRDGGGFTYEDF